MLKAYYTAMCESIRSSLYLVNFLKEQNDTFLLLLFYLNQQVQTVIL